MTTQQSANLAPGGEVKQGNAPTSRPDAAPQGLELRDVVKRFGATTVVEQLNLHVAQGEFIVLLGESGCGKSTTLRMIAGLEEVSAGKIFLNGRDITQATPRQRDIAMVFQSYALYPHMSVAQNMSFALQLLKRPRHEIEARVAAAAQTLHIEHLLQRKPRELSGGQRQRVAIGRAIVREPEVFLFDEPLSNLDAKLRGHMRAELAVLHRRLGKTTVYVTHDQVEAMTLASRIVIFNQGRIQQIATPEDIFKHPANLFVAGFIGTPTMNFFDAQYQADTGVLQGERISWPAPDWLKARAPQSPLTLGLRPQALRPCDEADAHVHVNVDVVEYLGTESQVTGHIDGNTAAPQSICATLPGNAYDMLNHCLPLCFDPRALHVFDRGTGENLRQAVIC